MIVYRLCKKAYVNDLSGKGAEIARGIWNSKGTAVLYTSASRALCAIEIIVHTPAGIIPQEYFIITIELPDNGNIPVIALKDIPDSWDNNKMPVSTRKIGDDFISEGKSLILKVPSAIIKNEWNYLVNPSHHDFKKIKIMDIEPFTFDDRLFK